MPSVLRPATSRFRAAATASARSVARSRSCPPDWGFLRILVADDCAVNRLVTQAQLAHWGIEPQFARDGVEAVNLALERDFDIILMDVQMPALNGFDATALIRRLELEGDRARRVPVVAYSTSELGTLDTMARQSGMDAVLYKPCAIKEMGECLRRWCEPLGFAT